MSYPPGSRFSPNMHDIRVTFLLKGEEANEFRRWMHKKNLKPGHAGKILLLEGLKKKGYLPDWWRVK